MPRLDPRPADLAELSLAIEKVGRTEVPTFYQDVFRSHAGDSFRRPLHIPEVFYRHLGQLGGFWHIWRNQQGAGKQKLAHGYDCVGFEKCRAVLTNHDGVDDQKAWQIATGYGLDNLSVAQRAGLGGLRGEVFDDGLNLISHQAALKQLDATGASRVLHRDQGDGGSAINAELMKSFEVGLQTCATARIRARYGERDGNLH
jgi:hypothetical protein